MAVISGTYSDNDGAVRLRVSKYSRDSIAQVLQASDIVAVVGASLELKSAGSGRFKALCPFHREKTPSFHVSGDRQSYHCFGCGKGGDALSFVMEYHGLSFAEGLRSLADRAGVCLPEQAAGDNKADFIRKRLQEFNVFAAKHFEANLNHAQAGEAGRAYLAKRRLKQETVRRFGLGFAQKSWSDLCDAARKEHFEADVLNACGMFKSKSQGPYDFFRMRLIFPIKDVNGQIVAFGGRALDDDPAKYINTPETPLYRKSNILYGLHEGRDAIRREKRAILVEGYFDALRCFDAGVENVVAPCGTALTAEQANLIHRYANEVVVVFDGDSAGIKAALKGIRILTAAGLSVRALVLPNNQDPDDFIGAHGKDVFLQEVDKAQDFIAFYAAANPERLQSIEGRNEVLNELFEIVHGMDNAVRADEYLKHIAKQLNLSEHACRQEFSKFRREPVPRYEAPMDEAPVQPSHSQDDCDFIMALVRNPELLDMARRTLAEIPIPQNHMAELLSVLFKELPSSIVLQHLESAEARHLYTSAVNGETISQGDPADLVSRQINGMIKRAKEAQAKVVMEAIQAAERARDNSRMAELLREKFRIDQELQKVGQR